jgi:hypothetical protein
MKLLKKILILTALLLISFTSNARISNLEKEVLVAKMSNEANVIKLFKNKFKLAIINGIDLNGQQLPKEIVDKISATKMENVELINNINRTFPELANLNATDKAIVVEEIFKTPALGFNWTCFGAKVALFAAEILGSNAFIFSTAVFVGCISLALVADIAADIASGGLATAIEIAGAVPEVAACRYLAMGSRTVSTLAISSFFSSLYSCVTY